MATKEQPIRNRAEVMVGKQFAAVIPAVFIAIARRHIERSKSSHGLVEN